MRPTAGGIEKIAHLDVELVDLGEEGSDSVVRSAVVQEHQLGAPRR